MGALHSFLTDLAGGPRHPSLLTLSLLSYFLADMGAAYGTAKSGVGIMKAGVQGPELIWKNLIPIIM